MYNKKYIIYTSIICILVILILYIYYFREKYDTREGVFASIVTEQSGEDGDVNRVATHYEGILNDDGWTVNPVEEGIISTTELQFIDNFYRDAEGRKYINKYTSDPVSYPEPTILKKFTTSSSLFSELDAGVSEAEQRAAQAEAKIISISGQLETAKLGILPIQSGNLTNRERISDLENQLEMARVEAEKIQAESILKQNTHRNETLKLNSTNFLSGLMSDVYQLDETRRDITPGVDLMSIVSDEFGSTKTGRRFRDTDLAGETRKILKYFFADGNVDYNTIIPHIGLLSEATSWKNGEYSLRFEKPWTNTSALKNLRDRPTEQQWIDWGVQTRGQSEAWGKNLWNLRVQNLSGTFIYVLYPVINAYYRWKWGIDFAHGNTTAFSLDKLVKDLGISKEDTITIEDDSPFKFDRGETYKINDETHLNAISFDLQKRWDNQFNQVRGLPVEELLSELNIQEDAEAPDDVFVYLENINKGRENMFLPAVGDSDIALHYMSGFGPTICVPNEKKIRNPEVHASPFGECSSAVGEQERIAEIGQKCKRNQTQQSDVVDQMLQMKAENFRMDGYKGSFQEAEAARIADACLDSLDVQVFGASPNQIQGPDHERDPIKSNVIRIDPDIIPGPHHIVFNDQFGRITANTSQRLGYNFAGRNPFAILRAESGLTSLPGYGYFMDHFGARLSNRLWTWKYLTSSKDIEFWGRGVHDKEANKRHLYSRTPTIDNMGSVENFTSSVKDIYKTLFKTYLLHKYKKGDDASVPSGIQTDGRTFETLTSLGGNADGLDTA
jgi:hypothetical protein